MEFTTVQLDAFCFIAAEQLGKKNWKHRFTTAFRRFSRTCVLEMKRVSWTLLRLEKKTHNPQQVIEWR